MFARLSARLAARLSLPISTVHISAVRPVTNALPSLLLSQTRTLFSSAQVLYPAAAATSKTKPATKRKVTPKKKTTTTKKAAPKKKVAVKKKTTASKKKKVVKKVVRKKKKAVVKKDPGIALLKENPIPKPPANPLAAFVRDRYAQDPSLKAKTTSISDASSNLRELVEEWKNMDAATKERASAKYHAEHADYLDALKKWRATVPDSALRTFNKQRKAKGLKPTKRRRVPHVRNAYLRFFIETVPNRPADVKMSEWSARQGAVWKAMSEAEKKPYVDAWKADTAKVNAEHGKE
ncbi:hypothetical protein DL96DRAFT_1819012 [Flagelloscypha sp. PMI_526]|nr:hypothetical protein DL96DRAFT_1819012 [Flagelloscypha sp. PMI_526]